MKYVAIVTLHFKQHLVYRSDIAISVIGQIIRITIYAHLWNTLGVVEGINPVQLTTYSLLAFILARSLDSSISFYLGEAIKDGSIAIHLLRPINLQVWMLVRSLSESLFALLINGVPLLVTCALVFPLVAPASLAAAGLFLVSIALAALIGGTFSYLIGIVSFWTYNAWGVSILKQLLIITFSGSLVPLMLLPAWLEEFVRWLPFAAMVNQPIQIYLGITSVRGAISGLLFQAGWAIALFTIGRVISHRALSALIVQGG